MAHYLVAGLGNPGEKYSVTRHNVGRMVVERTAELLKASEWHKDTRLTARIADIALGENNETTATLVLPDTYMNRSGNAIKPLVHEDITPDNLIVVHDDIDLPLGTVRIAHDRGAGGHNGILSIEDALKTRSFTRLKVGVLTVTPDGIVRKPQGEAAVHHFILKPLSTSEKEQVDTVVERASQALIVLLTKGRDAAMCEFN